MCCGSGQPLALVRHSHWSATRMRSLRQRSPCRCARTVSLQVARAESQKDRAAAALKATPKPLAPATAPPPTTHPTETPTRNPTPPGSPIPSLPEAPLLEILTDKLFYTAEDVITVRCLATMSIAASRACAVLVHVSTVGSWNARGRMPRMLRTLSVRRAAVPACTCKLASSDSSAWHMRF